MKMESWGLLRCLLTARRVGRRLGDLSIGRLDSDGRCGSGGWFGIHGFRCVPFDSSAREPSG